MSKISKHLHNLTLLLSASVLIFTATMLRSSIGKLSAYFTKQTVSTRKPLNVFYDSLASIEKKYEWKNEITTQEIETDEYFLIELFEKHRNTSRRKGYVSGLYYSDPSSKVPHTPDVCYRQAGSIIREIRTIPIELGSSQVDVTLVRLEQSKSEMVILFCFIAEGKIANSRTKVRLITSKPGNKHTYFCKVEVGCFYEIGEDPQPNIEIVESLLSKIIPKLIDEYLPTEEMLK